MLSDREYSSDLSLRMLARAMSRSASSVALLTLRRRSLKASGLAATRTKWETHWAQALTEDDFNWLMTKAHCTTIRLPVGFFTLGPAYCTGTPFDGDPAQVYINAWAAVKNLILRCYAHGIGVLIDFHALPGGANGEEHSGTSSGKAELWGNTANLALAQKCVLFMANEIKAGILGVIGIQLCNEAITNAPGMYDWYNTVISAIRSLDFTMPIYISDGWDFKAALKYVQDKNKLSSTPSNPIIIDKHNYYTFSDADLSKSPQQIIQQMPAELSELDGVDGSVFDRGASSVFIGEYADVMDTQTWNKVSTSDRPGLTKQFGQAQSKRWKQRSGGCTYWTLKMDWMDGGDWGFKQQVNNGAITPPPSFLFTPQNVRDKTNTADSQRANLKNTAYTQHQQYWDHTAPGVTFEHYRFEQGWDVAFSDAETFLNARRTSLVPPDGNGADVIGMLDLWVLKRMREAGQAGQLFGWEWEQGFRRGISDFHGAVGLS
jgi:aryl-phospho-beta-D-glucosidase BglC (GH1 family)